MNKKGMFSTLIFFFILGWFNIIFGQSVHQLLDSAKNRNPELKALYHDYLAALQLGPQVSQLANPEVGIGAFISTVETRVGAQKWRFGMSQMFPWFGTNGMKESTAISKAQIVLEKMQLKELEYRYTINKAYYRIYEIEESVTILKRKIDVLETIRRISLSKVESGAGSSADVLRTDLKIEELKQDILILQKSMIKPLSDINQILNKPSSNPVLINEKVIFTNLPYIKDSLYQSIDLNHPLLIMLDLKQEVSRQEIELSTFEGRPSFGIGMDYILVDPRTDAEPINNGKDIFQVGLKVSVPLYRKKYEAREHQELLNIQSYEYRKEAVKQHYYNVVDKAYADHETAVLKKELYERQIQTARSAIRILESDYSSRGRSFDELLRLEEDLISYDLKLLNAIVESQIAKALIETVALIK